MTLKFWQVSVQDSQEGSNLFWGLTKKEAMSLAKGYIKDETPNEDHEPRYISGSSMEEMEFTAAGVMKWLNSNYTLGNG